MANEKWLDLIDRKALEEHIGDCYGYPAVDILHEIAIFPGVDAVEVVRCKDCKHRVYLHVDDEIGEIGGCKLFNVAMPYDNFCSYGERKDNG